MICYKISFMFFLTRVKVFFFPFLLFSYWS